jgi:hypothetical protein
LICHRCATPIPDDSRFCLSCGADVSGGSGERTQPVALDPELHAKLQEDLGPDFVLERELGRGGMAAVFLATEIALGRKVAIKVLPPELTYGHGMLERFKREARVAATLDHPHIIPVHRVSTGGKIFWYVMKYLDGDSLAEIVQRDAPLPLDRVADILGQVAEALGYAHERGVVHRDVKPANVMIDARGWATVTDFGIAKAATQTSMTGSGSMIGTPYYMSPEQCSGKKISGASDQYSLGIMAFQMLTGQLPFTGDTVIEIVKKHCTDPVPPISVLRPKIAPELVAVVERALAKAPEERFSTTLEFAAAFAEAADVDRSRTARLSARAAGAAGPGRRSVTADVSPVPQAQAAAPVSTPRRRRRWIPIAFGGLVLALGSGALVRSLTHGPLPAPPTSPTPAAALAESLPLQVASVPTRDSSAAASRDTIGKAPEPVAARTTPRRGGQGVQARRVTPSPGPAPSRAPIPKAPAPAPSTPAPTPVSSTAVIGTGDVFVWSNPPIPFSIAGRRYEANPTTVRGIPAGPVTIRFEGTESTAAYEKTVQVVPGPVVRPGRIILPRKP